MKRRSGALVVVVALGLALTSCTGLESAIVKASAAPARITLVPDDYHVPYAGTAGDGRRFFLSDELFASGPTAVTQFVGLFLWKADGSFDSVEVTAIPRPEGLPPEQAGSPADDPVLRSRLAELGHYVLEPVSVAPFSHRVEGVVFGFVPQKIDGIWSVSIRPGDFIAYYAPWDGLDYDT